ncbi:MAG TPA: 30S ribosomal protein S3, partial [Candidatus Syntrophoarchaeum butanivorans]|nr:30S ribosomal protein S3 [Candidatus Syntrophoarchaeum butanivorans]
MAIEKKFVEEGYRTALLDEYFLKRLNRYGYGGMEINRTPLGTQITVYAERPGMIIGKSGKTIRRLTTEVSKEFNFENPQIDVQEVEKNELNAQMMASRLASVLERGWYFRRAAHSTLNQVMEAGALGCEVIISGKLTGPRSRTEKIVAGYIKHAGKPAEDLVKKGFAIAKRKLGVIGVSVWIVP